MISFRKKRFIFTSVALLLVCFAVIFFSLVQLSSISREVEKEHFRYLKTFTNFYSTILEGNLDEFISQTKFFVESFEETNLEQFLNYDETNFKDTELRKLALGFFRLMDAVRRLEITYLDPETGKLWFISFYLSEHESGLYSIMHQIRREISDPLQKSYLLKWLKGKEQNLLQVHPLLLTSPAENQTGIIPTLVIPISYTLYDEGEITTKFKLYFNAEFLSKNIKDFNEVSESVLKELFIVLQTGEVLSITNTQTPSINTYSGKGSVSTLYDNWPLFSDQEISQKQMNFNLSLEPNDSTGETDTHLELFRIRDTQEFWGLIFQISQEGFLRLNNHFFLSLSMLVLSLSFIFCAFYYTASYFYVMDTLRILEKDLLENALQFDVLTSVFTRVICQKKAIKMITDEEPFVLSVLDIDYFKRVNDEHGHIVGDQVLIELCAKTQKQLDLWKEKYPESNFSISRWGGEEFVILISHKEKELLSSLLSQLQAILSTPSQTEGIPPYTVSMGASFMTQYNKTRRESSEIFKFLFKEADLALYEAKQTGRNKIVFYSSPEEGAIL